MSFTKNIFSFTGLSGNILRPHIEIDPSQRGFLNQEKYFQTYRSPAHFFKRSSTIVTAPVVHSFFTGKFLLKCALELLKCLVNLLLTQLDDSKHNLKKSGKNLGLCFLSLSSAIMSPIINLIDCIGGGIKTVQQYKNKSEMGSEQKTFQIIV